MTWCTTLVLLNKHWFRKSLQTHLKVTTLVCLTIFRLGTLATGVIVLNNNQFYNNIDITGLEMVEHLIKDTRKNGENINLFEI